MAKNKKVFDNIPESDEDGNDQETVYGISGTVWDVRKDGKKYDVVEIDLVHGNGTFTERVLGRYDMQMRAIQEMNKKYAEKLIKGVK